MAISLTVKNNCVTLIVQGQFLNQKSTQTQAYKTMMQKIIQISKYRNEIYIIGSILVFIFALISFIPLFNNEITLFKEQPQIWQYVQSQPRANFGLFAQNINFKTLKIKNQEDLRKSLFEYEKQLLNFSIETQKIPSKFPSKRGAQLQQMLLNTIQIGTQFDYLNISQTQQFKKAKQQWRKLVPFDMFNYQFNPSLESPSYKIILNQQLLDLKSVEQQIMKRCTKSSKMNQNVQICLANALLKDPHNHILTQLEYLYYNFKYNTGKLLPQLPMCIYTNIHNIVNQNKYQEMFYSLEQLNYTNFKVVIVDDKSTDNSTAVLYEYLNTRNSKIKNIVTFVKNSVKLQDSGNYYMRMPLLCRPGQIVLNLKQNDRLIGHQLLKVLNVLYQDPNLWFLNTQLSYYTDKWLYKGISEQMRIPFDQYRASVDSWVTSNLQTFRRDVATKIPLQAFVEYAYNPDTLMFEPKFIQDQGEKLLTYSLIQISGKNRIKFIDEIVYLKSIRTFSEKDCQFESVYKNELKARMKVPFKQLKSLSDQVQTLPRYSVPDVVMRRAEQNLLKFKQCQRKNNNQI